MRKYYFLAWLLVTACVYKPLITAYVPQNWQCPVTKRQFTFSDKEKLLYTAAWHGIPSGRLVLEIKGIEKIANRDYYHIVATAGPNDFFSFFYNVKYMVETYIDKETGLTLKFRKQKISGERTIEEDIDFDRKNNTMNWQYTGRSKETIKSSQNTHDLLSFLYYFRLKGLEQNKTYDFEIAYNGKIWPVQMKVDDVKFLRLRGGNYLPVFYVELSSELIAKIMGTKILKAYVSADSKRVPVFFTARTKIGNADSRLINFDCFK
jgi:hypothetical protein